MRVEPRGRSASSPRTITLRSAFARQAELTHELADDRVVRPDRVLDDLRAEPAAPCRFSTSGRGSAGSEVVTPSLRASHSTVVPWTSVEMTTAKKKTTLKNRLLCGTRSITGKRGEHDRHRAA